MLSTLCVLLIASGTGLDFDSSPPLPVAQSASALRSGALSLVFSAQLYRRIADQGLYQGSSDEFDIALWAGLTVNLGQLFAQAPAFVEPSKERERKLACVGLSGGSKAGLLEQLERGARFEALRCSR